jgi:GxxExxY protein
MHAGNAKGTRKAINAGDAVGAEESKDKTAWGNSEEDRLATQVIDSAFRVHSVLGPGLLESVYEVCLARELAKRQRRVERQRPIPVTYDGERLEAGFRVDLLVDDLVVVEVKSVDKLVPVHLAQMLTYLRLGQFRLGYLLNFDVSHMKDGVKRVVA